VIPQELELVGNKGADGLWHLPEIVWEVTQVLDNLQQHGDPVPMHIPISRVDHSALGWAQEEMLDEGFVCRRGLEARIVTCHTHLPTTTGADFRE